MSPGADIIAMGSTFLYEGRTPSLPDLPRLADAGNVDIFSATAREIVARAQEEARALGRERVGTEHLVLAACADADSALCGFGIRRVNVLASVTHLTGPAGTPTPGAPPLTPVLRRVLDAAAHGAGRMSESSVGPEQLLIAVADERTCVGARVLADVGLDAARLHRFRTET
jgi:ATP-dependent Clp protease ATP-binding subunit ClpA